MRFLITGAYGFVGTNLCRYLTARGHACDALDLLEAVRNGVPYVRTYTWDALAQLGTYDALVHLAGKAHDLKRVARERSYFDVNVGLTERIFNAMQGKTSHFIYFSSSKASADGNAYGRSKLAAERFLNGRALVLRPAMIHGPGNKGNLNLLWNVAKRGFPWPLAAFENKRSFTAIENICAVVEALAATTESPADPVFPVADDETLSTNRLIALIAEANGRTPRLWRVPRGLMAFAAKLGDVFRLPLDSERLGKLTEDSFVDNAALKRFLGWTRMPITAEEGMRATLRSFVTGRS